MDEFLDRFSYYTIIGKDPNLLKGHIKNVKEHAGFDKLPCETEFIAIIYANSKIPGATTNTLINICQENNVTFHIYNEPTNDFLSNLYACWNLGYEKSQEGFVFRGGSDQAYNKDSFLKLFEIATRMKRQNSKVFFNAQTIEHSVRAMTGQTSRHLLGDFGDNYTNFNLEKFENYCKQINEGVDKEILTIDECLEVWGKPTPFVSLLGPTNRTEGCSWLMTKSEWLRYGPLPTLERNITGDCVIQDRLVIDGYQDYLVRDCITYHFFRGECGNLFGLSETHQ